MVLYAWCARSVFIGGDLCSERSLYKFLKIFSRPHLLGPETVKWRSCSFLLRCWVNFCQTLNLSFSAHSSSPSPGDIQSCRRPVGWNRLALPVPERLLRPAGPWQRLPHGQRRRPCTHRNVDVLLLRHSACSGMDPQGHQWY